eukprot:7050313-Pyramimonas_sp.AAC.1
MAQDRRLGPKRARGAPRQGNELKIAKGNAEVDLLAKVGAEMDAYYGKHQTIEDTARRVRWAVQYI